jgi:hypothetical protein
MGDATRERPQEIMKGPDSALVAAAVLRNARRESLLFTLKPPWELPVAKVRLPHGRGSATV